MAYAICSRDPIRSARGLRHARLRGRSSSPVRLSRRSWRSSRQMERCTGPARAMGRCWFANSASANCRELQPPAPPLGVVSEFVGDRVEPVQIQTWRNARRDQRWRFESRGLIEELLDPPPRDRNAESTPRRWPHKRCSMRCGNGCSTWQRERENRRTIRRWCWSRRR